MSWEKRKDAKGQDLALLRCLGVTGQLTEAGVEWGSVFSCLLLCCSCGNATIL